MNVENYHEDWDEDLSGCEMVDKPLVRAVPTKTRLARRIKRRGGFLEFDASTMKVAGVLCVFDKEEIVAEVADNGPATFYLP